MKTTLLGAAALMLLAAGAARAQEAPRPCEAEIEKFCKDVKPGEGRIVECLKAHAAELSAGCKTKDKGLKAALAAKGKGEAGKAAAGAAPAVPDNCKTDLERFCKDVKPGEGRIIKCLKEHEAELSMVCKAGVTEEKKEVAIQHPCATETAAYCPGLKPGDGKFAACMKEHETELSEACKSDLAGNKAQTEKRHPCAAETERFCKGMKPGEERLLQCLKEHAAELSVACEANRKEGGTPAAGVQ